MHGIHWKHFWIRIFCGMSARFSNLFSILNEVSSGSITFRPSSNPTGLGESPCSFNVSSEPFSLLEPLSCLKVHGRRTRMRTCLYDLIGPILVGLSITIEMPKVCK